MVFFLFLFSSLGLYTPIFYLPRNISLDVADDETILLQSYMGLAWILGCVIFGLLVVCNSVECRIARQYLCQVSIFMSGLSMLALTWIGKNFEGYVMFVWIYGKLLVPERYTTRQMWNSIISLRHFLRWLPLRPKSLHLRKSAGTKFCTCMELCSGSPSFSHFNRRSVRWLFK